MRYLPPYSPNLNLIERLWKFMREKVINLKYYPTFQEFKKKLLNFFDTISKYKEELREFITLKFQTFKHSDIYV
jgi:transposase